MVENQQHGQQRGVSEDRAHTAARSGLQSERDLLRSNYLPGLGQASRPLTPHFGSVINAVAYQGLYKRKRPWDNGSPDLRCERQGAL